MNTSPLNTPPLNILHLDTSTQWRGGQQQLKLLMEGLAVAGHRQRVACVPGSVVSEGLSAFEQLPLRPGRDPRNIPRIHRAPEGTLAAHTSLTQSLAALAGRRAIVHRRVDFGVRGHALKTRRAQGFVAVSEAVRQVLLRAGVPSERVVVVFDGVPMPPVVPPAELGPGPIALAVGALVDHKDHRTLAQAAALVPELRVLVAGEGPLRRQLEGGPLELLGQRDDVPALLARAQLFVHSSKEEGLGQAVIEAMRAGVPVVATRAGGVPETVGERGLLVPVGDAMALAQAMRAGLTGQHPDTDLAVAWAAEHLSVEVMVAATEQAYRRLS